MRHFVKFTPDETFIVDGNKKQPVSLEKMMCLYESVYIPPRGNLVIRTSSGIFEFDDKAANALRTEKRKRVDYYRANHR